jgi:hypothetical protein
MENYIFICSDKDIYEIKASNKIAAIKQYKTLFNKEPANILGPFIKPKSYTTNVVNISSKSFKARYNGWDVVCFPLLDDEDYCFISFIRRIEGSYKPTKKNIVYISEVIKQ